MSLTVTQLHPLFAARVDGLDIAHGFSDAAFAALRAAFEEHSVIVLPGQDLDDERQIAFSRRFGPLETMLPHAAGPDFVYAHKWAVGDIVIWDNRAVLHRGRPWNETAHRRTLHRTTVAGDAPTV